MPSAWDEMQNQKLAVETGNIPDPQTPEEAEAVLAQMPDAARQQAIDIAKTYELKHRELVAQQQLGVKKLGNEIDTYAQQEQEWDNRPLLALADMFTSGNNYSRFGYAPSETPAQKQQKLMALREGLQSKRENLTKSQMDGLKEQLSVFKSMQPKELSDLDRRLKESQIISNNANAGLKAEERDYKNSPQGKYEKLGAEVKQKVGFLTGALQNLTDYDRTYDKGERQNWVTPQTAIAGNFVSSTPIDDSRVNLEEAIGRLASGSAITKDEEKRFRTMIPTAADNESSAKRKRALLRREFENKLNAYGVKLNALPALGFDPESMGYGKEQRRQELLKKKGQ